MSEKVHQDALVSNNIYKPNLEYLEELAAGDQSFIIEIMEMFVRDAPDMVHQAVSNFENRDYNMLRMIVHKLKSSVQVFGVTELANTIQQIECNSSDADNGFIASELEKLKVGIKIMVDALQSELAVVQG